MPLLQDADHAVWLLPTPAFRDMALASRGALWEIPGKTSDPERARLNLTRRDQMFTERLAIEAERLHCRTLCLDIGITENEVTARVSRLFGLPA